MLCSSAFVNSRKILGKYSGLVNLAATFNLDLNFFGLDLGFQSKRLTHIQNGV